jgi:hypothetical protein
MARKRCPIVVMPTVDRTALPERDLSPKGLSMFTRKSASGVQTPHWRSGPTKARGRDHNSKEQLIEITRGQLRKVEIDLRLADTPAQRANALAAIGIKQRFIETLLAQIAEGAS